MDILAMSATLASRKIAAAGTSCRDSKRLLSASAAPPAEIPVNLKKSPARDTASKRSLTRAFESFKHAADSLEKSYGHLQAEVLRLRFELERTNRDLASSLAENARMRRYLARVIEALPCGVLVVNQNGEICMSNPEARRLVSAPQPETLEGSAPAAPAIRRSIEELRSGAGPRELEWEVEGLEGSRTIGFACAVLGEEQGPSSESVFLLRDITEEKREAAARELARRKESLAEMATLLAHEIRNPLGSLELFASLLADAAAGQPDLRRWTDHIQAGLRSLSATVNNVLQFHSQPAPQLAAVNLGRLLRESVEFLRPLSQQAGMRIDLENSLGELEISADAHRLQQVFFNLALNAFRAMSLGGILAVRLRWQDHEKFDRVRIEFADSGEGIEPAHLPNIFEPGFTTQAGNPGLGLAVCRAVVEQHDGSIECVSEPGQGATFSICLPRQGGKA
ncbi:MAG: sensor histidine kinase [Candidatus Acidiferrales bacterium]